MAVLGLVQYNSDGVPQITTELATTMFGIVGGVGSALAQIIVSKRLDRVDSDQIPARYLTVPVAVSIVGTVLGSMLIPTEE
jgi:Na+-translocating ferredoxin:NAD+ oxidoreductase RnfA subunit